MTSPVKFTAPAPDFCRAVQNAALFASPDKTMPVLGVVHLRMVDGVCVAEATDRYAVCQEMIRETEGDPGGLLLVARNAARTCKQLEKITSPLDRVEVTWDPPADPGGLGPPAMVPVKITHRGRIAGDTEADIDVYDFGDYREPREWVDATIDRNWAAHYKRLKAITAKRGPYWDRREVLRMTQLDRLVKVATAERGGWRNAEFQHTGEGHPVAVQIGAGFRALLMPVKGA